MKIDFYLLDKAEPFEFACKLLEKAYNKGHKVFVYCKNLEDSEHLDELLWTYKDNSFIPHNLQGEGPMPPPAVQIGYTSEPNGFDDILLNLSPTIAPFHQKFQRILHIVTNNEEEKEISRSHYRFYKKQGFIINTIRTETKPLTVS